MILSRPCSFSSALRNIVLLIGVALAACSSGPGTAGRASEQPVPDPGPEVTVAELRRDLYAFADDSMQGRETGTAGAIKAARFLSERVQRLGLEPAGDSLFLQRIPLSRESFAAGSRISVRMGDAAGQLMIGRDIVPLVNLGPGVPPAKRNADGEVVFVSYGLKTARPKRDDFAGLDLEGKVVVVINGAPAGADSATRSANEAQTAITNRLAVILPQHPAAVVILLTGSGSTLFDQVAPELERTVSERSALDELPDAERPLPMILLSTVKRAGTLLPRDFAVNDKSRVMSGTYLSAHVQQTRVPFSAYNVVAVLRGSDPAMRNTYVALGAHYDHIGIVPPVNGDSIANGADDDGSGSVSLLAIARTLARGERPRRSVLFVWHVGEEKGLLGSAYFVDHPTVPIDSIVAQLNADMIGRNAPSLLYLVGPLAAPNGQSKRLGAIVDSVNSRAPEPFTINREWDSLTHPEHIYERSDHFNYARKGIPIVFFTTGIHDDYHKPSDEAAKIDYAKMSRAATLIRDAALAVANSVKRPR